MMLKLPTKAGKPCYQLLFQLLSQLNKWIVSPDGSNLLVSALEKTKVDITIAGKENNNNSNHDHFALIFIAPSYEESMRSSSMDRIDNDGGDTTIESLGPSYR